MRRKRERGEAGREEVGGERESGGSQAGVRELKMGFRGQWGVDRLSSKPEDSGPPAPYGDWDWDGGNGPSDIANC